MLYFPLLFFKIKALEFKNFLFLSKGINRYILPFLLAIIFVFSLFLVFLRIFSVLRNLTVIGSLIAEKTIDLAFLGIFGFLVLSNVITAFGSLFQDEEIPFLLRFPVSKENIFLVKFLEGILYSSWATLLLAIPLIISYLIIFPVHFFNLIFLTVSFPFFLFLAGLTGFVILFGFLKILPGIKRESLLILTSLFLISIFLLYLKFLRPEIFKIFETEDIRALTGYLSRFQSISPFFLPSRWMSALVTEDNFLTVFLNFSLFPLSSFSLFPAIFFLSNLSFEEKSYKRKKKISQKINTPLIYNPYFSVWNKEFKSFVRDFGQFSQGIFLLILVIFYVISIRRTPIYFKHPFWHIIVSLANFSFLGYLIATFAVRFLFPSHSLEHRGIILFKTSFRKANFYFLSKLLPYIIFFLVFTLFLYNFTYLSLELHIPKNFRVIFAISLLIESICIALISFSIGIIYPNFGEKNPSKIASGAGGFLTALVTIGYVISGVFLIAQPVYFYSQTGLVNKNLTIFSLTFFLFFSIILFIFFYRRGISSFKKQEF